MKVIIAGSRTIYDYSIIEKAINNAKGYITITEIISGDARGVDTLAVHWANNNNILVKHFPAKWDDLSHPDAIIKINKSGRKYDAKAGYRRNIEMANYAGGLIAIWDKKSKGTKMMIDIADKKGLKVYIHKVGG